MTTRRIHTTPQRNVQTQAGQTREHGRHDHPPQRTVRTLRARARLVGTVQLVAGVVLEAVVEQRADAAHARHDVHQRARSTQRRRLLGRRAVATSTPAAATTHRAPITTTHAARQRVHVTTSRTPRHCTGAVSTTFVSRRRVRTRRGGRTDARQQAPHLTSQTTAITTTPPGRLSHLALRDLGPRAGSCWHRGSGGSRRPRSLAAHSTPPSAAAGKVSLSADG